MSQHVHDEIERHEVAVAEREREARIRRFRNWWFASVGVVTWALTAWTWYHIGHRHGYVDGQWSVINAMKLIGQQPAEKPQ